MTVDGNEASVAVCRRDWPTAVTRAALEFYSMDYLGLSLCDRVVHCRASAENQAYYCECSSTPAATLDVSKLGSWSLESCAACDQMLESVLATCSEAPGWWAQAAACQVDHIDLLAEEKK